MSGDAMSPDEMGNVLLAVRGADLSSQEGEMRLREDYRQLVEAAWRQGEDWWIYDVWSALVDHHLPLLHRGFFLDQWDYLLEVRKLPRAVPRPIGRELRLEVLQAFVSFRLPEFARILDTTWLESPESWRDEIARLLVEATRGSTAGQEDEADRCRLTAESLVHLHNSYWLRRGGRGAGWEGQARADLVRQLEEFERAEAALRSELYDPAELLQPGQGTDGLEGARSWVSLLCYLAQHVGDRFRRGSLNACVAALGEAADTEPERVTRLLRLWSAQSEESFVHYLLQTRLGDRFAEPILETPSPRLAFHGCDHWILLAGERQVGKSSLLFASEQEVDAFHLESTVGSGEEVERLRRIWKEGVPKENEESWKTQHLELRARIRRRLCQFNLYDLPGEEVQKIGSPDGSIRQILEGFAPSAILLVFDLAEDLGGQAEAYLPLLNLLAKHAEERSGEVPPIYFLLNKSDLLLAGLAVPEDSDPERIADLARHLEGEVPLGSGSPFFRFRQGQEKDWEAGDLQRWALADAACCRSPGFLTRLLTDLGSLEPLLQVCRSHCFRDLSVVYTSCLYREGAAYPSLAALWQDVIARVAASTEKSRSEYFEEKVEDVLERDLGQADSFPERARVEVPEDLALEAEDLEKILSTTDGDFPGGEVEVDAGSWAEVIDSGDGQAGVYRKILRTLGQTKALGMVLEKVHRYEQALQDGRERCRQVTGVVLEELGIPGSSPQGQLAGIEDRNLLARNGNVPEVSNSEAPVAIKALHARLLESLDEDSIQVSPVLRQEVKEELEALTARVAIRCRDGVEISYESVPYDSKRGAETTLCAFRDRRPSLAEQELLESGMQRRLVDVLLSLDPLEVVPFVRLLKNHSPFYALSSFSPYEKDAYKWRAVEKTAKDRSNLENEHLLPMLMSLVRWRHKLDSAPNPAEVRRRAVARYIRQALADGGFHMSQLKGPEEVRNARNQLAEARKVLAEARGKLSGAGSLLERVRQFKGVRELVVRMQALLTEIYSLSPGLGLELEREKSSLDRLDRRLEVASLLLGSLLSLAPGLEEIDLEFVEADLSPADDYDTTLEPYAAARRRLVVRQWIEYLQASDWLPRDHADFLRQALAALRAGAGELVMGDGQDGTRPAALHLLAGLRKLRSRESLWRPEGVS